MVIKRVPLVHYKADNGAGLVGVCVRVCVCVGGGGKGRGGAEGVGVYCFLRQPFISLNQV